MGFGSYDESEQQNQDVNAGDDDGEGVNIHENDYEGRLQFNADTSTDELVDQLAEIKDSTGD